jgi:prepilin-type N-terminal cleavage/methylation domain-containing protein
MKKILKAFTLIELIVVISIITIISASWVFYFLDFVKEQEINQKLSIIEDDLNNLDKQVKDYKIFDYELKLDTSNTWFYITYINKFDSTNQTITINSTWSWFITTGWITWSWIIKIYKNHKLFVSKEIDRINSFEFDFNETSSYKITWTNSWEILNDIELKYFSEDNIHPENNDNLELVRISETENWSDLWNIIIQNIWWKKVLKKWNDEYNEIYLFFENSWKEKFIKISK